MEEIIDPKYVPSTDKEQSIFEYKQKFVYAILESKVLTSKGKEIVCKHDGNANAQKAYKELLDHHTSSTSAQIAARDIQSYFTTAKFGDGVFHGQRLCEGDLIGDGPQGSSAQDAGSKSATIAR